MLSEKNKAIVKWCVKLLIGLAIVSYLIWKFDYAKIADGVLGASLLPLLFATGLKFLATILHSLTHYVCLPAQGMRFTLFELAKINLVIRFYSLFMPGGVSVTAIKWYKLSRPGGRRAQAAALVVFTRLVHTAALLTLCCLGLVLDERLPSPNIRTVAVGVLALVLIAGGLFFWRAFTDLIARLLLRLNHVRLVPKIVVEKSQKVWRALQDFHELPARSVGAAAASSMAGHVAETVALYFVAKAISLDLSFALIAWIRGIAVIAGLLPLSIAGLGIREAGFVAILRNYGVDESLTVSFSMVFFSLILLQGLCGGVLEWWEVFGSRLFRQRRAPEASSGESPGHETTLRPPCVEPEGESTARKE